MNTRISQSQSLGVPIAVTAGSARLPNRRLGSALVLCLYAVVLHAPNTARAQAGPPFLTNDPGTPGNANWEINIASMQTIARGPATYEVPQIDLNFGLGDRIQLTYEIPYILQTSSGRPVQSGWGNGFPGVKWRF